MCFLFMKLVLKAVPGTHSPSSIFSSVSFVYFLAHISLVYNFSTFGDGKEGREDEGEAHMVCSDHEQVAGKCFNVSSFTR